MNTSYNAHNAPPPPPATGATETANANASITNYNDKEVVEVEDPGTPKTIHMTPRDPTMNSTHNRHTTSSSINYESQPPPPFLPSSSSPSSVHDDKNNPRNIPSSTAATTAAANSSSYLQRSIPVHKRSHYIATTTDTTMNPTTNTTNNNNATTSSTNRSYYGYSITSSTRSVKSVGSSILDTEDDNEEEEDKSQTGISYMSNDYNTSLNNHNFDDKSVLSREIPRMVPSIGRRRSIEKDDHNNDNAIDDDKVLNLNTNTNQNHHHDHTMTNRQMEKYMKDIQISIEQGLRNIQQQNQCNHDQVMATLQNEANRRTTLESRLHAQILLQSETLIAMEVKLLKLEAKVEKRERAERDAALRRRNVNFGVSSTSASSLGGGIMSGIGGGINGGVSTTTTPTAGGHISIHNSSTNRSGSGGGGGGLENGTIDEEDDEDVFDMREIRVNTNESHSRNLLRGGSGGGGHHGSGLIHHSGNRIGSGTNIAVISSGASLASGVTATSFLDGLEAPDENPAEDEEDDDDDEESGDGDVEDEGDTIEEEHDGSASTPTQGSRSHFASHFANIESILLNPIQSSTSSEHGISTRAVRGEYDGNSSLATSVTNTTVASTIVTATTSGVELANSATSVNNRSEDIDSMLALSPQNTTDDRQPRSRSQSPLTVHSAATASVGPQSAASVGTVGTSIISTAAVAPARSFRARRDAAARMANAMNADGGRQITNRVVSFTSNEILELPPEISEAGDSITMPDELDNLSDVADMLAERGRLWRDEYEARLDAIQKRFNGD